jgi:hypothetical protein
MIVNGYTVGPHANLRDANLRDANLWGANLWGAHLWGANLWGANLRDATLWGANLRGADLWGADLRGADLWGADLRGADLRGADLRGADLRGADLRGADLHGALNIPQHVFDQTLIVPQEGDLIVWKKLCFGVLAKLKIPDGVPRHNATGRKCRAERAVVLAYENLSGNQSPMSIYDDRFVYPAVGGTVIAKNYDPDRWNECAGGIHFFITKGEAEAYS